MGHWNYRVMRRPAQYGGDILTLYIGVAYYGDDGEMQATDGPNFPLGEDLISLREDLTAMLAALDKDIVDE